MTTKELRKFVKDKLVIRGFIQARDFGLEVNVELVAGARLDGHREYSFCHLDVQVLLNKKPNKFTLRLVDVFSFQDDEAQSRLLEEWESRHASWTSDWRLPDWNSDTGVIVGYFNRKTLTLMVSLSGVHFVEMGEADPRWLEVYSRLLGVMPYLMDELGSEETNRENKKKALEVLHERLHSYLERLNTEATRFGLGTNPLAPI